MLRHDDSWAYHQDERDRATSMGCFLVLAIILGGLVIAMSAAVVG